jgi:pathogenesis-related protein 1
MRSTAVMLGLLAAACGSSGGTPDAAMNSHDGATADVPGGVGEPPELVGITLAHNQVRATVGVPALTWDPALAKIATDWVVQCMDTDGNGLVDHNAGRSATYPTYVGENIYASSGTATGQAAVTAWASESVDYTHATNTCATGKVCGHYTQLVWRDTMKVGCALHSCPGLAYPSTVVCDYGPGGNVNGQSPY